MIPRTPTASAQSPIMSRKAVNLRDTMDVEDSPVFAGIHLQARYRGAPNDDAPAAVMVATTSHSYLRSKAGRPRKSGRLVSGNGSTGPCAGYAIGDSTGVLVSAAETPVFGPSGWRMLRA